MTGQVADFDLKYFGSQFDLNDLDKISTLDLSKIEDGAESSSFGDVLWKQQMTLTRSLCRELY